VSSITDDLDQTTHDHTSIVPRQRRVAAAAPDNLRTINRVIVAIQLSAAAAAAAAELTSLCVSLTHTHVEHLNDTKSYLTV